jgi:hopene-associated glycosyltransferase HpnB
MVEILAWGVLSIWAYLIAGRGFFWLAARRDDRDAPPRPQSWPDLAALIPARDEAANIGKSLRSLLAQDYPGRLGVIIIDDNSDDGTAEAARREAAALGETARLTMLPGRPLPRGWTGKLFALKQGADHALSRSPRPDYLLLTDADIAYEQDALRSIVSRAVAGNYALTSVMAKLNCRSFAERSIVPAFIYFFQMLYPFAWVNRRDRAIAAAAGGCMLVRADALAKAGGFEAVKAALIDDCALARRLKAVGPIWLGLSERIVSIRSYPDFAALGAMIARSAYAELRYSPLRLAAAMAGMALTFLAPPLLAPLASGRPALLGLIAYGLMVLSFQPVLRLYRLSPLWGLALPVIAAAYMVWTMESAIAHLRGRGGRWKGRLQASVERAP